MGLTIRFSTDKGICTGPLASAEGYGVRIWLPVKWIHHRYFREQRHLSWKIAAIDGNRYGIQRFQLGGRTTEFRHVEYGTGIPKQGTARTRHIHSHCSGTDRLPGCSLEGAIHSARPAKQQLLQLQQFFPGIFQNLQALLGCQFAQLKLLESGYVGKGRAILH